MSLVNDPVAAKIREKHAKRQEQVKASRKEFAEDVASGEKKLVCEKSPSGLYYVSFFGGGQLPDELKGYFTSIDRLRNMVVLRYGKDIMLCR